MEYSLTSSGKATNDQVITLVHLPSVDPNFLNMSARSPEELKQKAARAPGVMLEARRAALQKNIEDAKQISKVETASSFEKKMVPFLEEKAAANEALWMVYNGQAGPDKEAAFFDASRKVWTEEIPSAFEKLAGIMKGPHVLGDQVVSCDHTLVSSLMR